MDLTSIFRAKINDGKMYGVKLPPLLPNHKWIPLYEGVYSIGVDGSMYGYPRVIKCMDMDKTIKGGYLTRTMLGRHGEIRIPFGEGVVLKYVVDKLFNKGFPKEWTTPRKLCRLIHLDGNKDNCHANNLVWMDYKKEMYQDNHAKWYELVRPDGIIVTVFNLKEYCLNHKPQLNYNCMNRMVNGGRKQYKGWILHKRIY